MADTEINNTTVTVRGPSVDLSRIQILIGLIFLIGTPIFAAVGNYYTTQNAIANQQVQINKLDNRIGSVENDLRDLQKERNNNLIKYESRMATVESKLDIILQRQFNLAPKESLGDIGPGKPIPSDVLR